MRSAPPVDAELIRELADDFPVGIWVARAPSGELMYANATFAEIMGMGPRGDVAIGEYAAPYGIYGTDGELYPEERMPFVRALRAKEIVVVDDIVIHRTDGVRVPIRAHARPLLDARGEVTHVVIAFFDIGKEVAAERARREAERAAQEASKLQALGNFAAGIAHDFNNVLAAVQILVSRLRMDERDPSRAKRLDDVEGLVSSGAGLARQLALFGGHTLESPGRVCAGEIAERIVHVLDRVLDPRVHVSLAREPGELAVRASAAQLEQILTNLALNARDAMTPLGGGELRIAVRREREHVVLEVSDEGPGVPLELRRRVFEPYFTTRSVREGGPGTGLGLATVYGITTALEGEIEVLDGSPQGALFRVRLPQAGAREEEAPARARERRLPEVGREGLVLLVEDEPRVRRMTGAVLRELGYDVLEASDGAGALETARARGGALDLVLLDVAMPGMDGPSVLRALRDAGLDVPVLLTTGMPDDPAVEQLRDEGAIDPARVLAKPYALGELAEAIEQARRPR